MVFKTDFQFGKSYGQANNPSTSLRLCSGKALRMKFADHEKTKKELLAKTKSSFLLSR